MAEPLRTAARASIRNQGEMSVDDAIRSLRADPAFADLVRDAYLGPDVRDSAARFRSSAEWKATVEVLRPWLDDAVVVDLGAGSGIASAAFAHSGARSVYAVEPDPSDEVGRGAIARLAPGPAVTVIDAMGEDLPLDDASVDIVYARQVLHHASDLPELIRECARVLRHGGAFFAVREHVVADASELEEFLANHPVHRLAGGENAYRLDEYERAIRGADLTLTRRFGPWDSVINAFPAVASNDELAAYARTALATRFGAVGALVAKLPGVDFLMWNRIRRHVAGEIHAFLAVKTGP